MLFARRGNLAWRRHSRMKTFASHVFRFLVCIAAVLHSLPEWIVSIIASSLAVYPFFHPSFYCSFHTSVIAASVHRAVHWLMSPILGKMVVKSNSLSWFLSQYCFFEAKARALRQPEGISRAHCSRIMFHNSNRYPKLEVFVRKMNIP